jgi:hypothetical protein
MPYVKSENTRGWHSKGSNAWNWKDHPNYRTLHRWVQNNKPHSEKCERCGKISPKLDCANISGNYTRDVNDYIWLCRSCHMRFDNAHMHLKQGSNAIEEFNALLKIGVAKCCYCGVTKPVSEFAKNCHNTSRIQSYCKDCAKQKCKEHYIQTHPDWKPRPPKSCKYTGVSKTSNAANPWRANITISGVRVHLGVFKTEEEAGERYRMEKERLVPGTGR